MSEDHDQSARRSRRNKRRSSRTRSGSDSGRQRNGQQQERSGGSRRRRRNRRGGSNQSNQNNNRNGSSQRRHNNNNSNSSNGSRSSHQAPYKHKTPPEKLGGREPINPDMNTAPDGPLELDAFELFCTYHLGITSRNTYERPNARDVARRFDVSVDEMHDALRRFHIDHNALQRCSFDLSLARLDIRVAPEGIDRREIAKMLFSEMLETNDEARAVCQEPS